MTASQSLPTAVAPDLGAPALLQQARLEVDIDNLTASYAVNYRFHNATNEAVEAVFVFPVPLDAAFIGLEAEIAGERLAAEVVAAPDASRRYDDAVTAGDSALLLRQVAPGILGASLGNVGPGEQAEFTLRYARLLEVIDRRLRFALPFTIRPRYGRWRGDAMEEPRHDAGAGYTLAAEIRVRGLLAGAGVHCPSHPMAFEHGDHSLVLRIDRAWLDGDLVINFAVDQAPAPQAETFPDQDGVGVCLTLPLPAPDGPAPAVHTALLLDCSGSMLGAAVLGCRKALGAVVDVLGENDRLQILRFGSTVQPLLRRPVPVTASVRESVHELARAIQADLGGTNMGPAIETALTLMGRAAAEGVTRALILVTDGAVLEADINMARQAAIAAGVRIFVVAVGSSAGVDVLAPLAESTGGRLEQVTPGESIAVAVERQVRRLRQGQPHAIALEWDVSPHQQPASVSAYAGDVVTVHARFTACPTFVLVRGATLPQPLRVPVQPVVDAPARRALLGLALYRQAQEGERGELALRYGLLTAETSAVVVKRRRDEERLGPLPAVHQVPQMLSRDMFGSTSASAHHDLDESWDDDFEPPTGAMFSVGPPEGWEERETRRRRLAAAKPLSAEECKTLLTALRESVIVALSGGNLSDLDALLAPWPKAEQEVVRDLLDFGCLPPHDMTPLWFAMLVTALCEVKLGKALNKAQRLRLKAWLDEQFESTHIFHRFSLQIVPSRVSLFEKWVRQGWQPPR